MSKSGFLFHRGQPESTSKQEQMKGSQGTNQTKPSILKSKNKDGCKKSSHRVAFDPSKYGVRFYFVDNDSECLNAGPSGVWSYISNLASKFQAWCKRIVCPMEQFNHNKKSPRKPTRRGRYRRYRSVDPRRGGRSDWDNWPLISSSHDNILSHNRPEPDYWRATSGEKCQTRLESDKWCLSRESGEVTEEVRRLQQEGHTSENWTRLTELVSVLRTILGKTDEGKWLETI